MQTSFNYNFPVDISFCKLKSCLTARKLVNLTVPGQTGSRSPIHGKMSKSNTRFKSKGWFNFLSFLIVQRLLNINSVVLGLKILEWIFLFRKYFHQNEERAGLTIYAIKWSISKWPIFQHQILSETCKWELCWYDSCIKNSSQGGHNTRYSYHIHFFPNLKNPNLRTQNKYLYFSKSTKTLIQFESLWQ